MFCIKLVLENKEEVILNYSNGEEAWYIFEKLCKYPPYNAELIQIFVITEHHELLGDYTREERDIQ